MTHKTIVIKDKEIDEESVTQLATEIDSGELIFEPGKEVIADNIEKQIFELVVPKFFDLLPQYLLCLKDGNTNQIACKVVSRLASSICINILSNFLQLVRKEENSEKLSHTEMYFEALVYLVHATLDNAKDTTLSKVVTKENINVQ